MHLFKSKESLGILFAILAYFSFSVLDAFQKTAVIYHSIFQLLLIKYFFVLLLAYFESYRNQNIKFYLSKNIKLQIFRCILSIAESACFALAFRYLSLADAHSIGSLTPVIVVILSLVVFFVTKKNYVYPTIFSAICMAILANYF